MASQAGIRAGRSYVELFADDSRLIKGLRQNDKRLVDFGKKVNAIGAQMAGAGAALAAPLALAAQRFANAGSALQDASQRTGVAVEDLSSLGYAAEQSGTSLEALEKGLTKLAKGGAADPAATFGRLADLIANTQDPAERTRIALEAFGKSGAELLPLMIQGSKGIAALQEEADRLGITMSSEDAAAAETFGDALSKLSKVTDRGIQKIGAALAPALTDLADRFAELAAVAGKWIEDNRGIIQTVAMLAAGLVAGGAALAAFGTAAAAVGTTLGLLATGLQLVGAAIGFLVSPIGLVTAGLVGLGALFVTQTEAGKQMASELAAGFEGLKADALTAFGGISDALATGDIGKAAEILWLALKLQWTKGVNFVLGKWNEIKAAATNLWQDIGFAIERTMIDTVANLQKFWNGFRDFFLDMLDRLLGFWKSWVATITLQWGDIDKAAQETEQKIAARTAARKADNAKITAEAQKQKDLLAEGQAQVTGDRPAIDTQPLAAELEAARAAFEKSVGEAKEKRIAADQAKAAADAEQAKIPGPADLSKVMTETQTAAKASASGTFSAAAAAGLGATSVQERAAKASEETAANTKYLVDTAKRGPFVFQR